MFYGKRHISAMTHPAGKIVTVTELNDLLPVQIGLSVEEANTLAAELTGTPPIEKIQGQINILRAAMVADAFVPRPDGTKLKEHLYYIRLGAVQYLEWAIKTREQEEKEDETTEAELTKRGL
jgi:hypothetical protein